MHMIRDKTGMYVKVGIMYNKIIYAGLISHRILVEVLGGFSKAFTSWTPHFHYSERC